MLCVSTAQPTSVFKDLHCAVPAKVVAKVGGQGWLSDPLDRDGELISDTTFRLDNSRRDWNVVTSKLAVGSCTGRWPAPNSPRR